ncbi:MAG: hypothetical protein WD648_04135, partial [Planctomycetaceae bacterium]
EGWGGGGEEASTLQSPIDAHQTGRVGETHHETAYALGGGLHPPYVLPVVVVLLLVVCYAQSTVAHLPVWKDGMSLWRHAIERVPQLPVVQIQLANSLHDAGNDAEAIAVLEAVLGAGNPDELDRKRIHQKLDAWRK